MCFKKETEKNMWGSCQISLRWYTLRLFVFDYYLLKVSSSKENDSKSQFKEFERVLESVVKDAEKTRVRQHLRYK